MGKDQQGVVMTHGTGGQYVGAHHMDHQHNAAGAEMAPIAQAAPGGTGHDPVSGGPYHAIDPQQMRTYFTMKSGTMDQTRMAVVAHQNFMRQLANRRYLV